MDSDFQFPSSDEVHLSMDIVIVLIVAGILLFICGVISTMCIVNKYRRGKKRVLEELEQNLED